MREIAFSLIMLPKLNHVSWTFQGTLNYLHFTVYFHVTATGLGLTTTKLVNEHSTI